MKKLSSIFSTTVKGEFVAKHVANAAPQLAGQLHRGRMYRVRFNAVLQNPIIEEIEAEL